MTTWSVASGRRPGFSALVAGALIFAVALVAYAILAHGDPGQHWRMIDLQVYRWAGVMARQHRPVYDLKFEGFLSFTYTPFAALVFGVMSHLSLGVLRYVITGLSMCALLGTLWVAWGLAGVSGAIRAGLTLAIAGLALSLEPVVQTLGFGQINLLLMLLVVADLAQHDGHPWKGVGVGIAAAIKLTPGIFIAYLLFTRRFRAAAVAAGTFAAAVGLGFLLLPAASRRFWIGGLFLKSERVGGVPYVGNQSMNGALVRLVGGVNQARPAWFAAALLVGGAGLLLAAWASRRGDELLGITTCALTALLISPISWSHHWVWVVLLVPCAYRLLPGRRWTIGWASLGVVLVLFLAGPVAVIWRPPHSGNLEYGWHGVQLLAGNLYVLLGLLLLGLAAVYLGRSRSPRPLHNLIGPHAAGQPEQRPLQGLP